MQKQVEIFKPGIAELKKMASKFNDVKISDIDDEVGYKEAKEAKKELGKMRIDIKKYGKEQRDEALKFQREVIRQEKEHLEIIVPVEDNIKKMISDIDEAKEREDRKIGIYDI